MNKAQALKLMEQGYRLEVRYHPPYLGGDEYLLLPCFCKGGAYQLQKGTGKALARDKHCVDVSHLYGYPAGTTWSHERFIEGRS